MELAIVVRRCRKLCDLGRTIFFLLGSIIGVIAAAFGVKDSNNKVSPILWLLCIVSYLIGSLFDVGTYFVPVDD